MVVSAKRQLDRLLMHPCAQTTDPTVLHSIPSECFKLSFTPLASPFELCHYMVQFLVLVLLFQLAHTWRRLLTVLQAILCEHSTR